VQAHSKDESGTDHTFSWDKVEDDLQSTIYESLRSMLTLQGYTLYNTSGNLNTDEIQKIETLCSEKTLKGKKEGLCIFTAEQTVVYNLRKTRRDIFVAIIESQPS